MVSVTKCSSSQGEAIANDDRLIKRDINVYRSHVKITAYNSYGYKVRIFFNVIYILCFPSLRDIKPNILISFDLLL